MSINFGLDLNNRITSFSITKSYVGGRMSADQLAYYGVAANDPRLTYDPYAQTYTYNLDVTIQTKLNAAQPRYIDVAYDPYPVVQWGLNNQYLNTWYNYDLKTGIGDDNWQSLWSAFKFVPRNIFEEMSCDMLSTVTDDIAMRGQKGRDILLKYSWRNFITKDLQTFMLASQLIDIFTRSNVEAMQLLGITNPSDWETKKAKSFSLRNYENEISEIEAKIEAYPFSTAWLSDDVNAKKFELRIKNLPKTKDPMLNVQRDVTLAGMLANKDWSQLNLLCAMYENMDTKLKDVLATV